MKLKDKKLRKRLEKIFPHSEECIRVIKELRGVLKMFHPDNCVEPYRIDMINELIHLFKEQNTSYRKELLKRVLRMRIEGIPTGIRYTSGYNDAVLDVIKIIKERRPILADLRI